MTEGRPFIFEEIIAKMERERSGKSPPTWVLDGLVLAIAITDAKRKLTKRRLNQLTRHVETFASMLPDDEVWQAKCRHWLSVLEELRKQS